MVTQAKSVKYAHKEPDCWTYEPRIHFPVLKFLRIYLTVNLSKEDAVWRILIRNCIRLPEFRVIHCKFARFLTNALIFQTLFKYRGSFFILGVKIFLKLWLVNLVNRADSLHRFKYWQCCLSFVIILVPYDTRIIYTLNNVVIVACKVKDDSVLGIIAQVRWPAA